MPFTLQLYKLKQSITFLTEKVFLGEDKHFLTVYVQTKNGQLVNLLIGDTLITQKINHNRY